MEPKKPEEIIKEQFDGIKETLEKSLLAAQSNTITETVKKAQEDTMKSVQEAIAAITPGMSAAEAKELTDKVNETIKGFDEFQKKYKAGGAPLEGEEAPSLMQAITNAIQKMGVKDQGIAGTEIGDWNEQTKNKFMNIRVPLGKVDLKADMTTANTLTGNPQRTYNNRQGIIPAQKLNIRDLMNTVDSPTGTFVTYTENSGETNNITTQVEGATKGQNQYLLTEKVNTQSYIAGYSTFTKQLMKNLPFLQNTLPRLLLRDFYKKENSTFYTAISGAATGPVAMGVSADDVKQLINLIAGFSNTDYSPSWVAVNWALMGRLVTSTYNNGYYPGAGSLILNGANSMSPVNIMGTPIFPATWVADQKALLVDMDYLERVETEGLNLVFSFENGTNFVENKVTARIECQESVNLMLGNAACFADLGTS